MGVNLKKYKDKHEEQQRAAAARQAGGFNFWKPKDGTSNIRLMPPWQGDEGEDFEREIWMHWNVGTGDAKSSFVCPVKTPNCTNSQGVCEICNYVEKLRSTGEPADEEIAEELRAKSRYYVNIIDNEDPSYTQKDLDEWQASQKADSDNDCPFNVGDTKYQAFQFGPMVYEKLLKMFSELQMDLTDLVTGFDILITKSGKGKKTKYECMVKPPAREVKLVGSMPLPNLDLFAKAKDPAEMYAALASSPNPPPGLPAQPPPTSLPAAQSLPPAGAAPMADEDDDDDEDEAPPPAAAKAKSKKTRTAAAPAPEPEPEPEDEDDDGPPECFKDAEVFAQDDPVCVGGKAEDGQDYDPCPFYQECGQAVGVLKAPAKKRRRSAAKAPPATEADALEQEMANSLK